MALPWVAIKLISKNKKNTTVKFVSYNINWLYDFCIYIRWSGFSVTTPTTATSIFCYYKYKLKAEFSVSLADVLQVPQYIKNIWVKYWNSFTFLTWINNYYPYPAFVFLDVGSSGHSTATRGRIVVEWPTFCFIKQVFNF